MLTIDPAKRLANSLGLAALDQQIAGSLAGSQEYAALAVLHDLDRSGDWDLIVVDTPPTAHALDFLDAPQKLTQAIDSPAIDSPAIDWFRRLRALAHIKRSVDPGLPIATVPQFEWDVHSIDRLAVLGSYVWGD